MAEGKKSFVLYCDQKEIFDLLPVEKRGQLITILFQYVNYENPEVKDPMVNMAFTMIRQVLKRDLKKYEERADRSRENGSLGGRPPKPKEPTGLIDNPEEPRKPDSVNDSVNDSDTVNVNVTVNDSDIKKTLMLEANASNVSIQNKEFLELGKAFYDRLTNNSKKLNVEWVHLKKIKAENFLTDIRLMINIDKRTTEDMRKVWKFIGENDFWMKNIQSAKKLRKNFDQLITNAKNGKQGKKQHNRLTDEQLDYLASRTDI